MPKARRKRQRKPRTDTPKTLKKVRELSPSHVVEIELQVTPEQSRMLQRTQEQLRLIRNTVLSELKTRYDQMVRTKAHKKIMTHLHKIHSKLECTINEEKIVALKTDQKLLNEALEALREAHQVTFNDGRLYAEMLHDIKFSLPDAVTVWTASEMAWQSIEGLLFHHAERVYFYKHDDLMTLQGKQADRSIIVKCDKTRDMWFVSHHGMTFPVIVKPHDLFIEETLSHVQYYWEHGGAMDQQNIALYHMQQPLLPTYRIRNNRIVTKGIRGQRRYFLQMVLEGPPIVKRKKDGTFRHTYGTGRIGTDLGTQSLGIVTKERVILKNLAERSKHSLGMEHKLYLLQRYMDRSKRATNPQNFDGKGRVKRGAKPWVFSTRYRKAQATVKELHRKAAVNRKLAHNEDVNRLRSYGDTLYIEPMDFKALQKKAKPKKDEKTGQWKQRKRFGKSIQNRAPSYLTNRAKQVFGNTGGHVYEVNNVTFAASQYDHMLDEKHKKKLSQRWHELPDGRRIQRDLYSAFLLYCADDTLKQPHREMCHDHFEVFYRLHNACIEEIRHTHKFVLNSGIPVNGGRYKHVKSKKRPRKTVA